MTRRTRSARKPGSEALSRPVRRNGTPSASEGEEDEIDIANPAGGCTGGGIRFLALGATLADTPEPIDPVQARGLSRSDAALRRFHARLRLASLGTAKARRGRCLRRAIAPGAPSGERAGLSAAAYLRAGIELLVGLPRPPAPSLVDSSRSAADRPGRSWCRRRPIPGRPRGSRSSGSRRRRPRYPSARHRPGRPGQGDLLRHLGIGAGGIDHGEDLVASCTAEIAGKAMQTEGDRAGDDQRLAACRLHRRDEIGIVPGADLALARHISGMRGIGDGSPGSAVRSGPCGTEAVVITGMLASVAILASAAACGCRTGIGMSPTVWNRPL